MEHKIREMVRDADGSRGELIPLLQKVQSEFGYISQEAVEAIAEEMSLSESRIYGVATFYSEFRLQRPGEHRVKVCMGTSCYLRGGKVLMERTVQTLGIRPGETTPDGKFSLERVACVGCCARSPVVVVDDEVHAKVSSSKLDRIVKNLGGES